MKFVFIFIYSRCQIYFDNDRTIFIHIKHKQKCTNANHIKYQSPKIDILKINNLLENILNKSIFVNMINII